MTYIQMDQMDPEKETLFRRNFRGDMEHLAIGVALNKISPFSSGDTQAKYCSKTYCFRG